MQVSKSLRLALIAALALTLLGLAGCNLFSSLPTSTKATPTAEVVVTEAVTEQVVELPSPTPEVIATPEPTALPPTPEPTATPISRAITRDNVRSMAELRLLPVSSTTLLVTAFSPVSHQLATFGYDKILRIWDADSGKLLRELTGHSEYGFSLAYSPDGSILASGADDYKVRFWDMKQGELLLTATTNFLVYATSWSPDGKRMAVAGYGSSRFQVIDTSSGAVLVTLQPGQRMIWSAAFSPDGSLLAAADDRGEVTVYSGEDYVKLQTLSSTQGASWDVAFSPDSSLLASCNDGGMVYIWRTDNWERVASFQAHNGDCSGARFSLNSDILFTSGEDGSLAAWDTQSGALLKRIEFGRFAWRVSVSGDGELVAVAVDDGSARIIGVPGR